MNNEVKLITAICENKDISSALRSPDIDDIFNDYKDVWYKMKDHYYRYRSSPTLTLVKDWFKDFEPVAIDGPTSYYIEELRNYNIRGILVRVAEGIAKAVDSEVEPGKIVKKLQGSVSQLNKMSAGIKDLNIVDSDRALKHYEQVAERVKEMGGAIGIQTKFDSIDSAYTTGMASGHFICIIGWPGHKKTFVGAQLAINVWKQGFRPMIVSLEMSPENMRDRIYTLMGEGMWRMSGLNRGQVDMDKFIQWTHETFEDRQDFIIISNEGVSDMTPATIQSKIDQYKPDFVLIDYLQLLNDNKRTVQDTARVMNISKELKLLAISNGIPVVTIISATSNDKEDRNHPPTLAQAAWSKSIEYDADMAFAVHTYKNETNHETLTELIKRKNRHGDDFDFFITLDPETGELEERWDTPDWLDGA
jgi:replicative DNA helicase